MQTHTLPVTESNYPKLSKTEQKQTLKRQLNLRSGAYYYMTNYSLFFQGRQLLHSSDCIQDIMV